MDCAIPAAGEAAVQAMGSQAGNGGTALCDQGRRFAELLQVPAGGGTTGGAALSVTDTYVPAPEPVSSSGGANMKSLIDTVGSIHMPFAQTNTVNPSGRAFESSSDTNAGELADFESLVLQGHRLQAELVGVSMVSNMSSSVTGSVRSVLTQQG